MENTNQIITKQDEFEKLPPQIAPEVLYYGINWKNTTLPDAFKDIERICATNETILKSMRSRLFESKEVDELHNRIKVLVTMARYKNKKDPDNDYPDKNALHYAAGCKDLPFTKEILPQLYRYKMLDIINEEYKYSSSLTPPLEFLFDGINKKKISDEDLNDLVLFFINNGATKGFHDCLYEAAFYNYKKTALTILSHLPCKRGQFRLLCSNGATFGFIYKEHNCHICLGEPKSQKFIIPHRILRICRIFSE